MKSKTQVLVLNLLLISLLAIGCKETNKEIEQEAFSSEEITFIHKLDSISKIVMDSIGLATGMSVTVVKEDKVLFNRGYGITDLDTKEPVTPETMFYIASVTKSFVGLLAATLDEKNIFKLNTTLKESFPNVKFNDTIDSEKVTMQHLLSHTSGVNNGPITYRLAYTGQINDSILTNLVKYSVPNGKALGEYLYDNTGYNLYTIALKNKTGIDWKEALEEHVLTPIEMKNTTAYLSDIQKKKLSFAKPYTSLATEKIDSMIPMRFTKTDATLHSAGGLLSNGNDLANWMLVHLNLGKLGSEQKIDSTTIILNHKSLADMGFSERNNQPRAYTLGWNKTGTNVHDSISYLYHYGGFKGFHTVVSLSPKRKYGLAITSSGLYSGFATSVIEGYIFNYFEDAKSADEKFIDRFQEGLKNKDLLYQNFKFDRKNRKNRNWLIDFKNDFEGTYHNEGHGRMKVIQMSGTLYFDYGNAKSIAAPYTEKNSCRVEFVPFKGETISFDIDRKGTVKGLTYRDRYYEKE